MPKPELSVVILTWNEAPNIQSCLDSLVRQTSQTFEAIIIDAGSTDHTVAVIEAIRPKLPFPLRLHIGPARMPIGRARNLGVAMAVAPNVAFLSADAGLDPAWVSQAVHTLRRADMAFGLQLHTPLQWTLGAAVRGLRYHFPLAPTAEPIRFASNVAAAYRKQVLTSFPFDPAANAAEDLLLATRASTAGYIATYDPGMVAHHRDVSSLRQEMRKNVREGHGCGRYARELGIQWPVLAWMALLAIAVSGTALSVPVGLALVALTLWLPALRRGLRRKRAMPRRYLLAGIIASPPFDLMFLLQYLRGMLRMRRPESTSPAEATP